MRRLTTETRRHGDRRTGTPQLCASVSLWFILAAATAVAAAGPTLVDAAKGGDAATLRALIDRKTDVNAAAADGTTALHWASYRDDVICGRE